jgi:hypothetical protein
MMRLAKIPTSVAQVDKLRSVNFHGHISRMCGFKLPLIASQPRSANRKARRNIGSAEVSELLPTRL